MKKKTFELIESGFTQLSLLFFVGNPINLLLFGGSGGETFNPNNSNFLEPAISLGIYMTAVVLLVLRWRQTFHQFLYRSKLIWLVILLILLSTLWSAYPDITLRRGAILLGATCFGVYFATRYSFKQQFHMITWAFGWVLVLCVVFAIALPRYGIMSGVHSGAWRGIYMHKNSLSIQMAITSLLFLLSVLGAGRRSFNSWAGCIGAFALMILSRASTGLIAFFVLLPIILLGSILRFRDTVMIPILIFTVTAFGSIFLYIMTNAESLLPLIGEDATLTGRTQLWAYVGTMIQERPWLGYGYEGFWRGMGSEGARIWRAIGWQAPHAHSGYLELLLTFGWIGTSIFALTFFNSFLRSLALIRVHKSFESLWFVVFLSLMVLTNTTEKAIFGGGMGWIIYVSICLLSLQEEKTIKTERFYQFNYGSTCAFFLNFLATALLSINCNHSSHNDFTAVLLHFYKDSSRPASSN
jgi:O-antigen ligase